MASLSILRLVSYQSCKARTILTHSLTTAGEPKEITYPSRHLSFFAISILYPRSLRQQENKLKHGPVTLGSERVTSSASQYGRPSQRLGEVQTTVEGGSHCEDETDGSQTI